MEEPTRSSIMILSDYAGINERRKMRPMAGRTGAELDRVYLPRAGFTRSDVYVSNAYKCENKKKQPPKHELVRTCAEHWLPWEIRRVQPEVIIVAGSTALKLFPGRRLEMHHGRPFKGTLYRDFHGQQEPYWSGVVWPTFNPAAGLRSPDYMTPLLLDFWHFGKFYRHPEEWVRKNVPVDPYPNPDYRLLEGSRSVYSYLGDATVHFAAYERPGVGLDTETEPSESPGLPDPAHCLSFSLAPGTGAVIMADDKPGLLALYEWLELMNCLIFIHNGLFDLPVVDRMDMPKYLFDVFARRLPWSDTMIRAYHQRSLPKALKILSYRELGCDMRTFDEVVEPPSVAKLSRWLDKIANHELEVVTLGKKGKPLKNPKIKSGWDCYRLPKQTGLHNKASALKDELNQWLQSFENEQWSALEASLDSDDDFVAAQLSELKSPWDKIKEWPPNLLEPAVELYGPPPIRSIAHVPLDEKIVYACRDADMALRLGLGLLEQKMVARLINA